MLSEKEDNNDESYDNKAMVLIIEQLQQKFAKFFGLKAVSKS